MLRRLCFSISLIALVSAPTVARASSAVFDLNLFYLSDVLSESTDSSHGITAYAFFVGFTIDNKRLYQLGWNYATYATTDVVTSTTTNYTSTQMGPAFVVYFDKGQNWRVSAAYNLVTNADYAVTGSTTEKWRGTGLSGDVGYQFHMSDSFSFGVRINYSKTSITESLVGTTQSDVSYSKTLMYPSVALTAEF